MGWTVLTSVSLANFWTAECEFSAAGNASDCSQTPEILYNAGRPYLCAAVYHINANVPGKIEASNKSLNVQTYYDPSQPSK